MEQHSHSQFAGMVVSCMDGRFRKRVQAFIEEMFGGDLVDYLAVPGSAVRLTFSSPKPEQSEIFDGIKLAYEKHGVRRLLIVEHEHCGKYAALNLIGPHDDEREIHARNCRHAASFLKTHFPELAIECYYARLDGAITPLR